MDVVASWPTQLNLADVAGWARRVEDVGFDAIHVPETTHDPFVVSALALANTSRITVRTSMVVAFPRSPMLTAYSAWDLARFSGGRFHLGLASQVRGNIVGRYSTAWSEPVERLGDYIDAVRAIFASFQTGQELTYDGPHYRFTRLQPYFNPGPNDVPAPQIWTGGVNRRMTALAGERSDGFVAHPTSSHPALLRATILPALEEGRARAGRDALPSVVAGPQPITTADPADLPRLREARRSELAFLYSTPAYRPQLDLFGIGGLGEALSAMAARSDWSDLAAHLTDEVLATLVPQGSYDELPDVLATWYAGLCDGLVFGVASEALADPGFMRMIRSCQEIPGTSAQGS
jgi:probable F420-dependent oxidoreductase